MANLRLTYSDIYTRVSNVLGFTDPPDAPTGDNLTRCKTICDHGLRRFLYPIDKRNGEYHEWAFLSPLYTINLRAGKWKYQLPDDFSSIITDPTYKEDENFKQIAKTTPENIMNLRAAGVVDYAPYYYTIVDSSYDPEIGEFSEIWFYPEPDSTYPIQFFYKSDPLKATNATDFLPGGVKATEAIVANCLAVGEQQDDDMVTTHHTALADKLTQDLIVVDSQRDSGQKLGNLHSSDDKMYLQRDRADFTVYGTNLT